MRIAVTIGASMLGLVLGTPAFADPQHGHEDDRKAGSQKEQGKGHQQERGRSSAQKKSDKDRANEQEQRREQHAREEREHDNSREHPQPHYQPAYERGRGHEAHEREQHLAHRDVWQDHRAQHWAHEHHTWHERGGYRGYRIPEDRFRAHFGRAHWFRVHRAPVIVVGGYPRFQYGGFWFSVVDPWPEYWSRTWYETDDVYIDYVNDGYYMYNRRHPGIAIAIDVSF
jgi:hypothetical protein